MPTYEVEKLDFQKIHCWECGARVDLYYTMFFIDEGGLNRYGAVCKSCRKKVGKRRNIIVHDGMVSPGKVAKKMTESLRKCLIEP